MQRRSNVSLMFVLVVAIFALVAPATAQMTVQPSEPLTVNLTPTFSVEDTGTLVQGSTQLHNGEEVSFTADYAFSDAVSVRYVLNDKEVIWTIGIGNNNRITLEGWHTSDMSPAIMESGDLQMFQELLYTMQLHGDTLQGLEHSGNTQALWFLLKGTELLTLYGVDTPIGGETVRSVSQGRREGGGMTSLAAKGGIDLCGHLFQWRTASWTDANGTWKYKNFVVGGHGTCMGGCGAGCPNTFLLPVRFTQDCLNHDACVREENACAGCGWGVCGGEYWAAADDFLEAPTCPEWWE